MTERQHFHPEYGYLVPTRSFRSTARASLIGVGVGFLVGSISVLALIRLHDTPPPFSGKVEIAASMPQPDEGGVLRSAESSPVPTRSQPPAPPNAQQKEALTELPGRLVNDTTPKDLGPFEIRKKHLGRHIKPPRDSDQFNPARAGPPPLRETRRLWARSENGWTW
jgi:hypothetical protein